jgi:hypothetical protein
MRTGPQRPKPVSHAICGFWGQRVPWSGVSIHETGWISAVCDGIDRIGRKGSENFPVMAGPHWLRDSCKPCVGRKIGRNSTITTRPVQHR